MSVWRRWTLICSVHAVSSSVFALVVVVACVCVRVCVAMQPCVRLIRVSGSVPRHDGVAPMGNAHCGSEGSGLEEAKQKPDE